MKTGPRGDLQKKYRVREKGVKCVMEELKQNHRQSCKSTKVQRKNQAIETESAF